MISKILHEDILTGRTKMSSGNLKKIRQGIKQKIRSSEGVTILLALLFFMLCSVVGSIILSASTAASGRLAGLKEQEKAYYEAGSAASFVAGMFDDAVIAVDQQDDGKKVYYALDEDTLKGLDLEYGDIPHDYQNEWSKLKLDEGDLFTKLLNNRGTEQTFMLQIDTGLMDSDSDISLAFKIHLTADDEGLIKGTVQLQKSSSDAADNQYCYDLKIPAEKSALFVENVDDSNTTSAGSGTESVGNVSGSQDEEEDEQKEIDIFRWKNPVITLHKEGKNESTGQGTEEGKAQN
jgi:hypothetical protein